MLLDKLLPILADRMVTLHITKEGEDTLRVSVVPKATKEGDNAVLLKPICAVGTAEELEAGLPDALTQYAANYVSLRDQLAQITAESDAAVKAAKDAAQAKLDAAKKKPGAGVTKPAGTTAAAPAAPAAPTPPAEPSLFG